MMKKVSVVILNWNGMEMLRNFLPSVVEYSKKEGVEVCVADNASTDSSVEMLRNDFSEVRLILLDKNYGFAEGYNRALEYIDSEYVVLLNSDVEVTPNWLLPLIDYMDAHPETAACQPKLRSQRSKRFFEYAGASGGYLDRYGYPFCRGRVFDVVEEDKGPAGPTSGGCFPSAPGATGNLSEIGAGGASRGVGYPAGILRPCRGVHLSPTGSLWHHSSPCNKEGRELGPE